MKPREWIMAVGLIIFALIGFGIANIVNGPKEASMLVITLEGETYLEMILNESSNDSFRIEAKDGHWNDVVIENGVVNVTAADCPSQICVKTKKASKNGDMIVCLPHELVIEIVPYKGE